MATDQESVMPLALAPPSLNIAVAWCRPIPLGTTTVGTAPLHHNRWVSLAVAQDPTAALDVFGLWL